MTKEEFLKEVNELQTALKTKIDEWAFDLQLLAFPPPPPTPTMKLIDGTTFPQHALPNYPSVPGTVASPFAAADHAKDCVISNLKIINLENNKAFLATLSRDHAYLKGRGVTLPEGTPNPIAWNSVTFRNIVMKNIHRNFEKSKGISIHSDGLYVRFGVPGQKIYLEDVLLEDMGPGVMPFLITDNRDVALISLKRVAVRNVSHSPSIKNTTGDVLWIEDCPEIKTVNLNNCLFKKIVIKNSTTNVVGANLTPIERI